MTPSLTRTQLSDDRLLLRVPTLADVDAIASACQDPEIPRWIAAIPSPYTVADARWFVTDLVEPGWNSGESLVWLILDAKTDALLGSIGLHLRLPDVGEVGFWLAAGARGRGVMTDAVELVCDYAFGVLNLQRLEWQAIVGNTASRAVAERAGFTFEGTLRNRLQQPGPEGGERRISADAWIAARLPPAAANDPVGFVPVRTDDPRVVLRPWRADDAPAVVDACQDVEIQRWTLVPTPYTAGDAASFLSQRAAQWALGLPSFAAVDPDTGHLLGSFGVVGVHEESGSEIGYWVAPWARRRGVATAALGALCRWLFEQGVPRITWQAEVGNVASREVAEAVGFVVEGTAREGLVQRGERVDGWVGSLLPSDFARAAAGAPRRRTLLAEWPSQQVELSTARLRLRAYRESDAPALLAYAADPVVAQWDPEHIDTLEDAVAWIRRRKQWADGRGGYWAIADLNDDRLLGGVALHHVDAENACAEVGYGVVPAARGQGLAPEAVVAIAEWVFAALPIRRISLLHAAENAPSCRVAERAGFTWEATLRQSYRYGDGDLHDEHVHARLTP